MRLILQLAHSLQLRAYFTLVLPSLACCCWHQVGGYSTMDLLHSTNLLNYFGKSDRVEIIENYPVLLQKGETNVALFGMGNIRDERLHHTFQSKNVKWYSR